MYSENFQYKFSFILSISFHLLLLFFFLTAFRFPTRTIELPDNNTQILHAVAVNQTQIDTEISRIKQMQQIKESAKQAELTNNQKQLQEIQQQKFLAQKQVTELQKQQNELKKQTQELQKQNKQQLENLKSQQLQVKKELQQIQASKKAAQPQVNKLKKETTASHSSSTPANPLTTAKSTKATITIPKKPTEQTVDIQLQQELAEEQKQLAASRSQYVQSILEQYKQLIISAIAQHWLVPSDVDKKLSCALLIQLGQNGAVLNVQIARSSGISALDRSAILAVYKASPLPVPNNPDLFVYFKTINLVVRPENITSG